jgi:hypothetical protein
MPENVRALIVVLVLAVPAFYIGKRLANSLVSPREFAVWRNAWFAITIVGFLSTSFIVFVIIEAIFFLYLYSTRAANVPLFVILLFATPLVSTTIGMLGAINNLIELNNARFLAIALLLPALVVTNGSGRRQGRTATAPDWLIVSYALVVIVLQFRLANITSVMRAATGFVLDVLVPYFAFSRTARNLADFNKILLAFVIAVIPLSLIAVVETAKGWPLYDAIVQNWGGGFMINGREGMLRGGATAGAIPLGFIIMVAIGCMLAAREKMVPTRKFITISFAILALGLAATLSRGPWVGTAALLAIYFAISPKGIANLAMSAVIGGLVLLVLLQLPVGQRLADFLPFVGSVDTGTITYRQDLFAHAIPVIERNLLLGSVDYLSAPELQSMVQGQGIVDLVNTYLIIVLDTGLVGLGLFVAFFATVIVGLWRVFKSGMHARKDLNVYAQALVATLIGILVTIATVSSVGFIPYVYWSFAGLCVSLIRIAHQERAAVVRAVLATQVPR